MSHPLDSRTEKKRLHYNVVERGASMVEALERVNLDKMRQEGDHVLASAIEDALDQIDIIQRLAEI